jgi:hypothetical protein
MKRFVFASLVVFGFALAAPAFAQSGAAVSDDPATNEETELAGWQTRLDEALARITSARQNIERLEGAKGRGAARRYPRGDAKEKYIEELEAAREELADAEEAMPELLEEARRAGVPNGVLDRYESAEAGASEEEDS